MSVVANRTGSTATITITIDVTAILALPNTVAEKRIASLAQAIAELTNSITGLRLSDTQLDQQVTDVTAQVAAAKAARPTGTL